MIKSVTIEVDDTNGSMTRSSHGFTFTEMIGIFELQRASLIDEFLKHTPTNLTAGLMPDNTLDRLLSKKQPPVRLSKKPLSKTNKYLRDPKMRKKMIATSVRTSWIKVK